MAYAKNKNSSKGGKTSTTLHAARQKPKTSRRAREFTRDRKIFKFSRRTVLTIIILASLTLILAVLYFSIATPENIVKRKVETIAKDYYENYFYEDLLTYTESKSLDEVLASYTEHGFATVTLRQLLLFDNRRHNSEASFLKSYCDENSTTIRIYPHSPYSKTDYEIKYNYSCNF